MKKIYHLFILLILLGAAPRAVAQYYGIGVNVAALAAGTVNASFEAAIAPHWSVDIPLYWNPVKTETLRMKCLAVQPGVRYWLFEEYAGHFIGGHLAVADYDVGGSKFHRAGWLAGLGVSYGYSWLLATRWNFSLEIGAGIFYMQDTKRDHHLADFQNENIRHVRRIVLGPSKCTIGFTYLF